MLFQRGSRKNPRTILSSLKRRLHQTKIHFFNFGIKKRNFIFCNETCVSYGFLGLFFGIYIFKFFIENTIFFHRACKLTRVTCCNISSFLSWKKGNFILLITGECLLKIFMTRISLTFLTDKHLSLVIQSTNSQRMDHVFIITSFVDTWFFYWLWGALYIFWKKFLNCNHFSFHFFFFLTI